MTYNKNRHNTFWCDLWGCSDTYYIVPSNSENHSKINFFGCPVKNFAPHVLLRHLNRFMSQRGLAVPTRMPLTVITWLSILSSHPFINITGFDLLRPQKSYKTALLFFGANLNRGGHVHGLTAHGRMTLGAKSWHLRTRDVLHFHTDLLLWTKLQVWPW